MNEQMNPILASAVESVAAAMGEAFTEYWNRPGAAARMEEFLDGRLVLAFSRQGMTVLVTHPVTGPASDAD